MRFPLFAISAISIAASSALAQPVVPSSCRVWSWKPGQEIVVEAALYRHTTITLPEASLEVVWASKELWNNEFVKTHLFVQPTSAQPQGAETTLTAVGESNNTYNFILRRVAKPASNCLIVKTDGAMLNKSAWDSKDSALQSQVAALSAQLARANVEKAAAAEENVRQSREAIKAYRSALHTSYTWKQADGWYASNGVIDAVQDDGRMTYVRLRSDNKGILSVMAEIDGQSEIVESTYDAAKREYKIAGIFPKFSLRAGNSSVVITRN